MLPMSRKLVDKHAAPLLLLHVVVVMAPLLQVDPGARLTAAAALQHPWVAVPGAAPTTPLHHALAAFRVRHWEVGRGGRSGSRTAAAVLTRCSGPGQHFTTCIHGRD
jgi:hypothetical protein